MGKYRQKKKSWHHLNPRSRIPELLAKIPNPPQELIRKMYKKKLIGDCKHTQWHWLFSNMFAWEVIEQIKLWANKDLDNFRVALNFKQQYAWRMVFGKSVTPKEAIEIIKRNWWPAYPPLDNN